MKELKFESPSKEAFINVTEELKSYLTETGKKEGVLSIFLPHTTAGLMINDKVEAVCTDMSLYLNNTVPMDQAYVHEAGNTPAHIKSALLGNSLNIPFTGGKLLIGEWQAVYVCEFDGPKAKRLYLNVI